MTDLRKGELWVAPGTETGPTVLLVVERDGRLGLARMEATEVLTPEAVQDRYGWASPVWRYASMTRPGHPPEVPVELVVGALQRDDAPVTDEAPDEDASENEPTSTEQQRAGFFAPLADALRRRHGRDAA